MLFEDREEAGFKLADKLRKYEKENPIILALPRGGVPIGFVLASQLVAPLSVLVVRKLGAPQNPELGVGAIAEGNIRVLDKEVISNLGISEIDLELVEKKESHELQRRVDIYRGSKPLPDLKNRTVILVDDGLATGGTARAAIEAIKKHKPKKIIFAIPVCARSTAAELEQLVTELLCIATPLDFTAVGACYRQFEQVSDEEVIQYLKKSEKNPHEIMKSARSGLPSPDLTETF